MFVTGKVSMTEESARDIWSVILGEVEKSVINAVGRALSPIRMAKLLAWCVSPTSVMTDEAGPLEALSAAAETLAAAEASSKARAGALLGAKVTGGEGSVQFADTIPAGPEEKQDMEAQGASRSSQLVQMYISAQLGRVAGLDEYQGLAYQSHWSSAKGLKQVAKNPTGLGFRTLAQHLEMAKSDGNLTAVDKFVQRTAEKFFLVGSTMWTRAGSRMLARWTRAKTFRPEDGRIAATYFSMYWEEYPGRGIPDVLDSDLIRDAERAVSALDVVPDRGGGRSWGPPRGPPSDAGMSAGGSSWGGSSVSQANTSKMEELMSAFSEKIGAQMQSLATEVGSLKKGHGDLMSRVGQIRDKPPGGGDAAGKGGRKCYFCKEAGHQQAECPLAARLLAQQEKEAKSE